MAQVSAAEQHVAQSAVMIGTQNLEYHHEALSGRTVKRQITGRTLGSIRATVGRHRRAIEPNPRNRCLSVSAPLLLRAHTRSDQNINN